MAQVTGVRSLHIIRIMVADGLVTLGAKALTAMTFTYLSQNNPFSVLDGFINET